MLHAAGPPAAVTQLPRPAATHAAAARPTQAAVPGAPPSPATEPVLCGHCGRTASNGLTCIGMCVADSGY